MRNPKVNAPLTVRLVSAENAFKPGREVTVGRSQQTEVHVGLADGLVSRIHLLRYRDDSWSAIDNNSRNGIYFAGQRVPIVPVHEGPVVTLGSPPQITVLVVDTGSVVMAPSPPMMTSFFRVDCALMVARFWCSIHES
jgi:pSer/pThr/pTyr-binding forkhead associated (FHA) protein